MNPQMFYAFTSNFLLETFIQAMHLAQSVHTRYIQWPQIHPFFVDIRRERNQPIILEAVLCTRMDVGVCWGPAQWLHCLPSHRAGTRAHTCHVVSSALARKSPQKGLFCNFVAHKHLCAQFTHHVWPILSLLSNMGRSLSRCDVSLSISPYIILRFTVLIFVSVNEMLPSYFLWPAILSMLKGEQRSHLHICI